MNDKKKIYTYLKSAGLVFLILFSAVTSYFIIATLLTRHTESGAQDSHLKSPFAVLESLGNDRWEAKQLIYHDIPARIVFSLPPAAGISADAVNEAVWLEFDRIGKIFNPFKPDSEISRLNAAPQSESIMVSDDVYSVMRTSKQLWLDTNGDFDPTMWPIKQLWQTAEKQQQIPMEKDIAAALQRTGLDKVRLDNQIKNEIRIDAHPVKFDFGGIVKGYAVDQVRQLLVNSGVTAGLVQLGGEICAFGNNNENPWRIGVQHPKQMDRIWGVLSSYDHIRVSTSGNYRQPILISGKSFYHIFSPKTGKPVSEKILGVTTASIDGITTNAQLDGIATAITVMGAEKGLALAEKLEIDAVILYERNDNKIGELTTPGLSGYYQRQ